MRNEKREMKNERGEQGFCSWFSHFAFRFSLFMFVTVSSPAFSALSPEFIGNTAFNGAVLRNLTPEEPAVSRKDDVLDWAADAEWLVERHYHERGWLDAKVEATLVEGADARDWIVRFDIEEGGRYRFGNVRVIVDGDSSGVVPGNPTLRARPGRVYSESDVIRDSREIRRAFGNAGFVRAEVRQHLILRDSGLTSSVLYSVERGDPVIFDTLIIRTRRTPTAALPDADSLPGLTRESLLRSFFTYKRGDTLRIGLNDEVIEKLQSTGQFNLTRLEDELITGGDAQAVAPAPTGEAVDDAPEGPARPTPQTEPSAPAVKRSRLILEVEEKVPGKLGGSVFYETQYGFGVSAQTSHSNLWGTLQEGRGGASIAQRRQTATLGYGSPLLFGRLLRFDNDLTTEWYQDQLPDEAPFAGDFRASNLASLSRNFNYWLRWVSGAEVEYKSRVVADAAGALERENGGLLTLANTGFVTFLDHPLNPTSGTRFALTVGHGASIYERGALRSLDNRHTWVETRTAFYSHFPGYPQFVGAVRLDGGRFFGAGGQNVERFFLGGPRGVRSYGFRQLCPDALAPPQGSCALNETAIEPAYVLGSAELRLRPLDFPWMSSRGFVGFFKPMEFVPFVDYGKVWNMREESASLSQDFWNSGFGRGIAMGGGVRYPLFGIFTLRLDFAWGRPGGGNAPDQWLIDLAQAF
jgi:outer membrane protein assembly factor BamA